MADQHFTSAPAAPDRNVNSNLRPGRFEEEWEISPVRLNAGLPCIGCPRHEQRAPVVTMGRRYKVFYHPGKLRGRARESAWIKKETYAREAHRRMEAKYGAGTAIIYVD